MDENSTPSTPNRIEDKAPKPKGVIPKNTQSLVIIGVAVLMILIMWLTGGGKKAVTNSGSALTPPPPLTPTDTSQVQAFKQTIQSEQQAARQDTSQLPSPDIGQPDAPGERNGYSATSARRGFAGSGTEQAGGPDYDPYRGQDTEGQPQPDPVKADQKKREYLSLFASNLALTYRKGPEAEKLGASPLGTFADPASSASRESASGALSDAQAQALRDAQVLAAMGSPSAWAMPPSHQAENQINTASAGSAERNNTHPEPKPANPDSSRPGEFNSTTGKKYVLFEGTVIETALINRLNGSFSGPVNCLVTGDVYSHDRQHVLIPAGTKVLGEAQKVSAFGQERLAVFFHRLIMPDGYSVSLDQFKGLDQEGATALRDKVNNHYARIFGASLAVGLLGGLAQVETGNIFTESATDRMRAGFGESTAMAGERILDRFLNILPTVTIREGARVNVYLSNDLLFPDYNNHTMPSDL
jgi:type IV secretory pathway VirB10-like protein